MSKRKGIENKAGKFILRSVLDSAYFGWMQCGLKWVGMGGQRRLTDAFMDHFGLDEEDFNSDTALQTFNRMNKEFEDFKNNKII